MIDEQGNEHEHEHDEDPEMALEFDTQSQIFLEMREQNLELLKIAVKVAGYGGDHPPLKRGDLDQALRSIWDLFAEFYTWVDPEEAADAEDDEDDEEEDE